MLLYDSKVLYGSVIKKDGVCKDNVNVEVELGIKSEVKDVNVK